MKNMKSKHKKLMLKIQRCPKDIRKWDGLDFYYWANPPIKYNSKIFNRLILVYYKECENNV